ncbi:DarT ssDNA thymidine ADP-ribosyltransferase family protein [Mucilaginibacter yixingensis]|uniref:DarT ssDNA thymidine ADP-ribosyltransferase family protein n=1 Tax=Mucilaginibacter yixingensis TaxID=1295612 RepID=UPI0034E22BD5
MVTFPRNRWSVCAEIRWSISANSPLEEEKILSRKLLESSDIEQTDILDFIEFPDTIRYDDKNYINLSISFPNHFLFKRFRERTLDLPHINWCVLKINPKYIYCTNTLFSVTNAASSIAKNLYGISGDLSKFKQLFDDNITSKSGVIPRGILNKKYPTDVQAEVLVKDEILVSDVLSICFKDEESLASGKASLSGYDTSKFVIDSSVFSNLRT